MIETVTYSPAPAGMNLALPPHELADEEARYLQDFLTDVPGVLKMRGPVQADGDISVLTDFGFGIALCVDPAGETRLLALTGPAAAGNTEAHLYSDDLSSTTGWTWTSNLFASTTYPVVDAKPALGGGTLIGAGTGYELSDTQTLGFWRGAIHDDYTTGTVDATRGSTAVTGTGTSWSSSTVSPGMFLLDSNGYLVGVVESVDSTTGITLEQPALRTISAGSYTLTPIRGLDMRVSTGRITCASDDPAVGGSFTKFKTNGLDSGTWHIFTLPELTYVGDVSSVTDDTSLTLTGNAAVALDNARYVAVKDQSVASVTNASKVGFLNAQYSGRQFYANLNEVQDEQTGALSSRVYFSDTLDAEAIDRDPAAGNFFDIGSAQDYDSPIYAVVPSYNALLFLKENEVFALYGNSPGQWQVRKLHDDGVLCGMSVVTIDGGVIWAGRRGVYFYDGVEVRNLTEAKLGNWFEKGIIENFDPNTDRMYGMIDRDHYFLFIEDFDGQSAGIGVTKGQTTTYPTRLTVCINLRTGGLTLLTNVNLRGSVELPAEEGKGTIYLVNQTSGSNGAVALARDLFSEAGGADTFTCDGDTAGPDPYIESKKYDVGDAQRKKLYKQLMMHYKCVGANMSFDTIVGLNDTGVTSSSTWTASSTWTNKRIKFLKRSNHWAFRIYGSPTTLQIGPWAIGFKYQRRGRV